jgi:class 3 adenylate cyclase
MGTWSDSDPRRTGEASVCVWDIREWRKLGLQTITVSSEGNLTSDDRGAPIRKFDSLSPPRKIQAILFGDFHGFSRLTDRQMLIFSTLVMQRIADVLDKYQNIVIRNTWGDGLFVVFSDLCSAARCALDIQAGARHNGLRFTRFAGDPWFAIGLRCRRFI